MATVVRPLEATFDECKVRVMETLRSEGYSGFLSFGNGWTAHARGTSTSAGCITSGDGTVVMMVAAGGRMVSEIKRLVARLEGAKPAEPAPDSTAPKAINRMGWTVTASELAHNSGSRYSLWCPPNGRAGPVWGSAPYSTDSSICTAAVHAGTLTFKTGGNAIIEMGPIVAAFAPSSRNGVTTHADSLPRSSFLVVTPAP